MSRIKIVIEEKFMVYQDVCGAPHYDWRQICTTWAGFDEKRFMTIKFHVEVKPGMRVTWPGTIATIGEVQDFKDGELRLLRLIFNSTRGDFTRVRSELEATALPTTQDQAGKEKKEG